MSPKKPAPDQEQIAAAAKKHFLEDFQGAKITLKTSFFHPSVIRAFKRTYYPATRNWWLATTLAGKLKDDVVRLRIQEAMLAKTTETLAKIKKAESQVDAVLASAELTTEAITRGKPYTDDVTLYGPVSAKFREIMLACDRFLDKCTLAYTMGEMDQRSFDEASREVKVWLKGIDTSLRNYRVTVMTKMNSEGGARPGYEGKKADAAGGAAGDAGAAASAVDGAEPPAAPPVEPPMAAQG